MSDTFTPQETSMNSFQETERKVFESLNGAGYAPKISEAIAHSFTKFVLGYITAEGAAKAVLDSGADEKTAREIGEMFLQIKSEEKAAPPAPCEPSPLYGGNRGH